MDTGDVLGRVSGTLQSDGWPVVVIAGGETIYSTSRCVPLDVPAGEDVQPAPSHHNSRARLNARETTREK